MELTGEKVINAPQARVYDALHDPVILRQAMPGVQSLSKGPDGRYHVTASLKLGPLRPALSGSIEVYNEDRPAGYSLRGDAAAGPAGTAAGNAHVALAAVDADTTNLAFHVTADLSGEIGSLEGMRLDVTARTLVAEFFSRLQSILDSEAVDTRPAHSSVLQPRVAATYQPPRFPPHSNYPDPDDLPPRTVEPSTTDATGGRVGQPAEPLPVATLAQRHPGNLPQTPYRSPPRIGEGAADGAASNGGGAGGVGRWVAAAIGAVAIVLLLNNGLSGF